MAKKETKSPVSKRAMIQRINRKLPELEQLKATRGERGRSDLGDYFIVDHQFNSIIRQHVDIENLGREMGVLRDYEALKD